MRVRNIAFCLLCLVCLVCMAAFASTASAKVYGLQDIMNPAMHNICAITFDDGPHAIRTDRILDALKEENVRATFFVLGSQVQHFPHIAQRIYAEGHEVGSHAFTHTALSSLPIIEVRKELEQTNKLLEQLDIPTPRFIRPPFGDYNGAIMRLLREMKMDLVLWSTDSYDWQGRPDYTDMPNMYPEVMNAQTQRGIFLFHDTKLVTAQDAKIIVQTLRQIGCKHFVTVSEYFDALNDPEALALLREAAPQEMALEGVEQGENVEESPPVLPVQSSTEN